MEKGILNPQAFCQVAIVVPDIEAARHAWARVLGVEPPEVILTGPAEETHIQYRGETTEGRAKLAFFELGQIGLELIEPVGGPSIWQEYLDAHGPGLHHIAFRVKGMDEVISKLEAEQMTAVQRGDYTGGCYAYLEGFSRLGIILELLEHF